MKIALALLLGCFLVGCGGSEPEPAGAGGSASGGGGMGSGGTTPVTTAGSSGSGMAGLSGAGGSGGSAGAGGASGGGGGAPTGGVSGTAGTSSGGASGCAPQPAGMLTVVGETVHDEKTCLDWTKATQSGVNYEAAEAYCGGSTLGGFDDWRIPTVSELASIVTACGKYPPEGPVDTTVFELAGDGYWTSTPAGEPNKVCAIGMANAGGYYHYGTAGPQVVRCVRGAGTFPMVKDCTAAMGCSTW